MAQPCNPVLSSPFTHWLWWFSCRALAWASPVLCPTVLYTMPTDPQGIGPRGVWGGRKDGHHGLRSFCGWLCHSAHTSISISTIHHQPSVQLLCDFSHLVLQQFDFVCLFHTLKSTGCLFFSNFDFLRILPRLKNLFYGIANEIGSCGICKAVKPPFDSRATAIIQHAQGRSINTIL